MKAAKITVAVLAVLLLCYTAVWFSAAHLIKKNLPYVQDFLVRNEIIITPFPHNVSGFPLWPALQFAGTMQLADSTVINTQDAQISIRLRGKPFMAPALHISIHGGATMQYIAFPVPFSIQEFVLTLGIPPLPKTYTDSDLNAWAMAGRTVPVHKLKIRRNEFLMEGDGFLTLDRNRQLAGTINTRAQGLEDITVHMVELGLLEAKQAVMAQSLLGLLSREEIETGETYIPVAIQVQNQAIFVGPIRVGKVGTISWPDVSE